MCNSAAHAARRKYGRYLPYVVDDEISKHALSLDGYGADDRWVLLEPIS